MCGACECRDHSPSRPSSLPHGPGADVEPRRLRGPTGFPAVHSGLVHDEDRPPSQVSRSELRPGDSLHRSRSSSRQLSICSADECRRHMTMKSPASNDRALAFLRISVGILFLIFGQYKVFGRAFTREGGFQFWINRFLQEGAYPFMVPVLKGFVLPHAAAIAWLVAFGEMAIAISLLLGLWTKPASIFGVIYMMTLLFSSNYPGAHAPLWQYFGASLDHSVLALCFLAFLLGDPERVLSVGRIRVKTPA